MVPANPRPPGKWSLKRCSFRPLTTVWVVWCNQLCDVSIVQSTMRRLQRRFTVRAMTSCYHLSLMTTQHLVLLPALKVLSIILF